MYVKSNNTTLGLYSACLHAEFDFLVIFPYCILPKYNSQLDWNLKKKREREKKKKKKIETSRSTVLDVEVKLFRSC